MDLEAFDAETFSGTARRSSRRLLASAAACKKQWSTASLDINMAFYKDWPTRNLLRQPVRRNAWRALFCRLDRPRCFEVSQSSSAATSRSTACSASSQ
eukprot:656276-Pyramimonas_sp.AAC.1